MFVDASALVAILKLEPGHEVLAASLESSSTPITSPLAILETVISLGRQKKIAVEEAHEAVTAALEKAGVGVREIDGATGELAVRAHSLYGRGSGHPARLNLGDCFAYAMAKQHRVPLLYKGDDFALTDLA